MKKSRAEWESEIERQAVSGLSQAAYARREGLNLSTFQYWRRKLKKEEAPSRSIGGFIDVFPSSVVGSGEIELELPHGIVLRVKGQ